MEAINAKLHGLLDYAMGIILISSPWLFNYSRGTADIWVPVIVGAISILYSLFTNWEYAILKKISIHNHLMLDLLCGFFLVAAPKIFDYEGYVYMLPYLWIGLAKLFISLKAGNALHSKYIEKSRQSEQSLGFKRFFSSTMEVSHTVQKLTRSRKSISQ